MWMLGFQMPHNKVLRVPDAHAANFLDLLQKEILNISQHKQI